MSTDLRCGEPNCAGRIVDGYCDVCGAPPPDPSDLAGPATPAGGPVARSGQGGNGSGGAATNGGAGGGLSRRQLPSAKIGSARIATPSGRTRRITTDAGASSVNRLGSGLVSIDPVVAGDPADAVMDDPVVPEERRFCASCDSPVGRGRAGHPGRVEGFCPQCRAQFSFSPKLKRGDLVGGQYRVVGPLAHGGLGWVYLARDANVSDRWVVLKGLLNSGDADAYAAAVAERQFLAQVAHPLIVEIYNFVHHEGAGYIVMEYVGGKSLKGILKDRMRTNGGGYCALPLDAALAYLIDIVPAFSYLHGLGLLYCDFKPDNVIQYQQNIKLIDLGGVRRVDDLDSSIYGTVGYQAPEVPTLGPSVASDIYTIGRTLAVLSFEFRGYQSTYAGQLPPQDSINVLAENDSFYRLLAKACAVSPDDRFQSADELREQMLGVLREVVAAKAGKNAIASTSAPSPHFQTPAITSDGLDWNLLPDVVFDPRDPGTTWLATVTVTDPKVRLSVLESGPADSVAVRLAGARAAIEAKEWARADQLVGAVLQADPWEWRAVWYGGLLELARGTAEGNQAAAGAFNTVYAQMPGEIAPKFALAYACELLGAVDVAKDLYHVCTRTDAGYVAPSAFGLARIYAHQRQLALAQAALELVPPTSRAYLLARASKVDMMVRLGSSPDDLQAALSQLESLALDPQTKLRTKATVFTKLLERGTGGDPKAENETRAGLERTLRELARTVSTEEERIQLVDSANRVRPLTWR